MTNEKIVSLMRTKTELFQPSNNWISVSFLRFLVVFSDTFEHFSVLFGLILIDGTIFLDT